MVNLRSLNSNFKEFCELMFVKQSLNAGKLVTTVPQFKEWASNIQGKLNERKRAAQEKKDGKKKDVVDYLDSLNKPEEKDLSEERKKEPEVQVVPEQAPQRADSDEDEPYDDAVFSSEEEEKDQGQALIDSIIPIAKPAKTVQQDV